MPRPDFSDYVVHFTKAAAPWSVGREDAPAELIAEIAGLTPLERLVAILTERVIRATPMPWTRKPSVCFTECVWGSLLDHAATYAPYGVGFEKKFLFAAGGGPAFYMRQDLYQAQVEQQHGWHDSVWPFITPFVPDYASDEHLATYWAGRQPLDYTREREWRVPTDLGFELSDVAFIIVATGADDAQLPGDLIAALGTEKILRIDNYRRINELWPWHHF